MTASELSDILTAMNMTDAQFGAHVGKHERTVRRWRRGDLALGDAPVPKLAAEKARDLHWEFVNTGGVWKSAEWK